MLNRALKNLRPPWPQQPERQRNLTRPLPWLVLLALMIALLLISCVAQLALFIVAPHSDWYTGDLTANGRVDYGYWPVGPLIPALNPEAIAAPPDETTPSADQSPEPNETALVAVIPIPSEEPVAVASPSPTASPPSSPTASPPSPTAARVSTATRTPTRTPITIAQQPSATPIRQATQAVVSSPTSTPIMGAQPSTVATSPPSPTATRTPSPTATRTPSPTATRTAVPGTPTNTPLPTNTPSPTVTPTPMVMVGFAQNNLNAREGDGVPVTLTFTVGVTTQPAGAKLPSTVMVRYTISDGTAVAGQDYQVAAATGTFSFNAATDTLSIPITILADQIKEGNERVIITLEALSGATISGGETATLTIIDQTAPPLVSFVRSSQTVSEGVGRVSIPFMLDKQSAFSVTVPYTIGGTAGATDHTLTNGTLTFPPGVTRLNLTFNILDDKIAENTESLVVTLGSPTNAIQGTPNIYTLTINDDDLPGVALLNNLSWTTSEAGASVTFQLQLKSQPTANVTIPLSSSNLAEGKVSPASLTFTPANWNVPRTVTVTGVDDFVDDGDIVYSVTIGQSTSADPFYSGAVPFYNGATQNGTLPFAQNLTNIDNDTAGVTLSKTTLFVAESGVSASYTTVLDSQPLQDVTITITADPQLLVNGQTAKVLTFTPANWSAPQTVTVSAVVDYVDEGPNSEPTPNDIASRHSGMITHTIASSDPKYNSPPLPVIPQVTAYVLDNDTAGMNISTTTGTTTEAGDTMTFDVWLNSKPTANVTIPVVSGDTTEGVVTVTAPTVLPLIFTPGNWNIPQTVTVTGQNDTLADGNIPYNVTVGPDTSTTDTLYNGTFAQTISLTNTDNDPAELVISAISGSTTEAGGTFTFTVHLLTEPVVDVTVPVASLDLTEGTVSPVSLTFTAAVGATSWDIPQTVTVTGVNDSVDDGNITYDVQVGPTSGDPTVYDLAAAKTVAVTNIDDDTAGVTVSKTTLFAAEGVVTDSYTVVLTSEPTAPVTISISITPNAQVSVDTPSLTFDATNWSTAQTVTVTAVDDAVDEGPNTEPTLNDIASRHIGLITHTITSSDPKYNSPPLPVIPQVTAYVLDNDTAGVTVTPVTTPTLAIAEGGATSTYDVVLTSEPLAPVTISITPDAQVSVNTPSLTFNAANWNTAQTVTVTAVNDAVAEGPHSGQITQTATSTDPLYNGIAVDSVTADITDNDVGVLVKPATTPLAISEVGPTSSTYTVMLSTAPAAAVTISITPDAQVSVNTPTLTFDATNWNVAQTVTVTAVDDKIDEISPHPGIVTHTATSTDPLYDAINGITVNSVTADITDNDTAGVTVTPVTTPNLAVAEAGDLIPVTYTVVLKSQPLAQVTIAITPDAQVSVNTPSLTFDSTNWNVAQTVTVTAVDDAVAEGPHTGQITHTATSTDPLYDGIAVDSVTADITDNDPADLVISTPSGPSTSENLTSVTFTVALLNQPTDTVTVPLVSLDLTEGTVSPASLTFTTANWSLPQTVTVTGVDDLLIDGPVAYNVRVGPTSGTATAYNALAPKLVGLTNLDNEPIGVRISDVTALEGDTGTTAFNFIVSLSAPADGDVSVNYTTADLTATAGSDYTATTGTATILMGTTTTTITVDVIGDTIYESEERFVVLLSSPTNTGALSVVMADNQGIGTILNDPTDQLIVGFSPSTYTVGEADGSVTLHVRLSAPSPGGVSVQYTTVADTATGADFTATVGTLNFAIGQIEQTFPVAITNDGTAEPDETFSVTLNTPVGLTLGASTATVTIIDDDNPPPAAQLGFVQTAGSGYNIDGWNYYANSGTGDTYLRIDVPCGYSSQVLQVDLYDAGINGTPSQDMINNTPDTTTFELYQMPAGWVYSGALPGMGATSMIATPYAPNTTNGIWSTLFTSAPGACGTYLLRVATATDDVNDWGIRVGWQNPLPAQPPTGDIDGVAGSGDEITFGLQQTTLRFAPGTNQCRTFYEYVRPGQSTATFNNYDLDSPTLSARVRYYPPSAIYDPQGITGGLAGTASGSSVWNLGTATTRGGDSFTNPESGWWRIVTCTSDMGTQNQLIQEGQTDQASYLTQQGTPSLSISVTPSPVTVAPGGSLSFNVNYTNTSSGILAGAAMGTTFTVTLPSDLTFVSCTGATCTLSGSTLTVSVGKVNAGATGTVTINTTASATGSGMVGLSLLADYSDVLGNPFVGKAGAVAIIN
ncbi:hypothetical protein EKD04_008760 [Chloroflexales bacterium ZM16-3]|nr:hypothetical protein [Chloroflexales bacterium ZM16-3]